MKRRFALAFSALLLSSCGEKPAEESAFDVRQEETLAESAPGINPTAAPGVAFNYRYAFRLPSIKIAAVQEEHAQACEKLGIARCRITGMRYQVRGQDNISAMLSFKLAPDIARQFGKSGIAAVGKAEGMVVDTEISGIDTSSAIAAANRNVSQIDEDIAALEAELAKSGLKSDARAELLRRIENLRAQRRSNVDSRTSNEEAVANTPMTFEYASGGLIPGFDPRSPLVEAFQTAGRIIVGLLSFFIVALAVVIPVGLFLALIAYAVRRLAPIAKRFGRNDAARERERETVG